MRVYPMFSQEDNDLARLRWNMATDQKHRYPKRNATNGNPPPRQRIEYAHQLVAERILTRKRLDGEMVDHINGNPLDCRRSNLRVTDAAGNSQNRECGYYRGTAYDKRLNKWHARIHVNRKPIHLGVFESREAARIAAKEAREQHGFLQRGTPSNLNQWLKDKRARELAAFADKVYAASERNDCHICDNPRINQMNRSGWCSCCGKDIGWHHGNGNLQPQERAASDPTGKPILDALINASESFADLEKAEQQQTQKENTQ